MLGLVLIMVLLLAGVGLEVLVRLVSRLGVDVTSWVLLLLLLGFGGGVVLTGSRGLMLMVLLVLGLVVLGWGDITVPGGLLLLWGWGGPIRIVVVVGMLLVLHREVITVVVTH